MVVENSNMSCQAEPYCQCWDGRKSSGPVPWNDLKTCCCGEESDISEWKWQCPEESNQATIVMSDDGKQVVFHPYYSSGTATVRGDTPFQRGNHYYWEVKMLSDTYGTDIMIGMGTDKMNTLHSKYQFTSLLGADAESYGLSYRGDVMHDSMIAHDCPGFCKGSIVGVRLDMWQGTLEFYLNRKPLGVSFYNLRRHMFLYPMLCSTAAQSCLRLTYAASWRASLFVDSAKILAASLQTRKTYSLPPGLWTKMKAQFWLTLPTSRFITENEDVNWAVPSLAKTTPLTTTKKRPWHMIST